MRESPTPPAPRRRKAHAKAAYTVITGFQPIRQMMCRCGWRTKKHYNRGYVEEQLREHIRVATASEPPPQEGTLNE